MTNILQNFRIGNRIVLKISVIFIYLINFFLLLCEITTGVLSEYCFLSTIILNIILLSDFNEDRLGRKVSRVEKQNVD